MKKERAKRRKCCVCGHWGDPAKMVLFDGGRVYRSEAHFAHEVCLYSFEFTASFNELARICYETAAAKGWWEDRDKLSHVAHRHSKRLGQFADNAIAGMSLALCHSELSEALEGIRHGNPPDDKVPQFTAEEAEYADTFIRIMDRAHKKKLRVAEAVIVKILFNQGRDFMHGGKKI